MKPRALIVEDDAFTREALRQIIESEGCAIDTAEDGEKAIGLLANNDYDVIILDIVLPRISGTAVMEQLVCMKPQLLENVIVVTGVDVAEIRKLFPNVCHALGKPIIPARLRWWMRKCLRTHEHSQTTSTVVA